MTMVFFFFNDTATTEIYTLSLHDALPIWAFFHVVAHILFPTPVPDSVAAKTPSPHSSSIPPDRNSTRLNSSHTDISRMPSSA